MSVAAEADALLKKHAALLPINRGPACSVEASGRRALIEALLKKGTPASALARILKAEGIPVSAPVLSRHARGECKCR